MPCKICKQKPVWKFTNQQQLCKSCFVKYFEKKVLSTIRKYKMPIDNIGGKIKGKIGSRGLKVEVINNIIKSLPERKGKLSDDSLDDISNNILYIIMYDNKNELRKLLPHNQPLYFLSNKEILLYAKINGIKGEIKGKLVGVKGKLVGVKGKLVEVKGKLVEAKGKLAGQKGKLAEIDNFINNIEQKNPDIRHNIINALLNYL